MHEDNTQIDVYKSSAPKTRFDLVINEDLTLEPVEEALPTIHATAFRAYRICGHLVADVSFHKE